MLKNLSLGDRVARLVVAAALAFLAYDHVIEGVVAGIVRVLVDERGGEVWISVCDEGIGIPPEALPHLFRRFYRTAAARERGLPGLGLGLFVTRSLIEAHGGRIWAESEGDGRGSRFTVVVPRRMDPARAGSRSADAEGRVAAPSP